MTSSPPIDALHALYCRLIGSLLAHDGHYSRLLDQFEFTAEVAVKLLTAVF